MGVNRELRNGEFFGDLAVCEPSGNRAVQFARGTEVSWYDREELRWITDEEARQCKLSK